MLSSSALLSVVIAATTLFAAAGAFADGDGKEAGLDVKIRLPSTEAPEGIQLPVLVTVSRDGIPLAGVIVRIYSTPFAAFVPDTGETGPAGEFRAVMLTPLVTDETVVAVIASASLGDQNETVATELLVWPEPGTEALVVDLTVEPRVLRAAEVAEVDVKVTDARGARVSGVTVVLLADPLLELSEAEGITDRNGSFRTILRARQSDFDAEVPLRAQVFKRGMSANESSLRLEVVRTVTAISVWDAYGGWIVLVAALGIATIVFFLLHYKYVRGTLPAVLPLPQRKDAASATPPSGGASLPGPPSAPVVHPPR